MIGMWPSVQRNNADIVDDLVENRHGIRRLKNLIRIVVAHWNHDGRETLRDTTVPRIEVLPGRRINAVAPFLLVIKSLLYLRRHGDSPIGRIYYQSGWPLFERRFGVIIPDDICTSGISSF